MAKLKDRVNIPSKITEIIILYPKQNSFFLKNLEKKTLECVQAAILKTGYPWAKKA